MSQLQKKFYRQAPGREGVLDFGRGVAILLMLLAHGLYFFSGRQSPFFSGVSRLGNTVCFTLFLFVSGAATYLAYLRDGFFTKKEKKRLLRRSFLIGTGFYLLALVGLLATEKISSVQSFGIQAARIVLFLKLPDFTEFIVPFLFFGLLVLLVGNFLRTVVKKPVLIGLVGGLVYFAGYLLYPLSLPSPWREVKALFVGEEGLYRFPFFQYFPVFLIGLGWGRFLQHEENSFERSRRALWWGGAALAVFLVSDLLSSLFPLPILSPLNRWPPSVGFLAAGLTVGFGLVIVYFLLVGRKIFRSPLWLLAYFGQDAFDLFGAHFFILHFYRWAGGPLMTSNTAVGIISVFFIFICVVFSSLNWSFSASIFSFPTDAFRQKRSRRIQKRYLVATVIFLLFVFWGAYRGRVSPLFGATIQKGEIVGQVSLPLPIGETPAEWFDHEFPYRQQLTVVQAGGIEPIRSGTLVTFVWPAAEIEPETWEHLRSQKVLVYYREGRFERIGEQFFAPDTASLGVSFEVQETVYPGKFDNRYFLYSGGFRPPEVVAAVSPPSPAAYRVEAGQAEADKLTMSLNRRWFFLPGTVDRFTEPLVMTAWLESEEGPRAEICGSSEDYLALPVTVVYTGSGEWTVTSSLAGLAAGRYFVRLVGEQKGERLVSQSVPFFVSAPVYVAWTMDWEGVDVPDSSLSLIQAQSLRHYRIPITHFFNPRIYLESVMPAARADYLTAWALSRTVAPGDEIQLHLHMHADLVAAAGVTPLTEPDVGGMAEAGYGVPTTSYAVADFERILHWGEDQFSRHDLPRPTGYRAGYWFANEEILAVLEKRGYQYDSSGRDPEGWVRNVSQPWRLEAASQPYFPSRHDQNSLGQDRLALLEIPNNGGNCIDHSAAQMVSKLAANFDGAPVNQKKAVVFLSHPQWQGQDQVLMEAIFSRTDEWLYERDQGPVIYTTLGQINRFWRDAEQ